MRLRWGRVMVQAFSVVAHAAPREFAVGALLQLLLGATLGLQLLIVRNLLSVALVGNGAGQHSYGGAGLDLVVLVIVQASGALIGIYQSQQQQLLSELVQRHAARPVVEAVARMELSSFESPEFHDRLNRAMATAAIRPMQVTGAVVNFGRSLLGLAGLAVGLVLLSPLLAAITMLAVVPVWMARSRLNRSVFEFMRAMSLNERRRAYILSLLTDRNAAKEMRAFGLAPFLIQTYDQLSNLRLVELRRRLRSNTVVAAAGSIGTALVSGLALAALVWLVTTGRIGVAEAGAAALAAFQVGGQLQALAGSGSQLHEASLFIDDLNHFVTAAPTVADHKSPLPTFTRLEAKNVSFAYPGRRSRVPGPACGSTQGIPSSNPAQPAPSQPRGRALEDVSIHIAAGEVIALVGENGSGKTTLAKILAGLYRPDSGSMLWNGIDVRELDQARVQEQVSVLFQDFGHYQFSAGENIGMGRPARMHDVTGIRRAAERAGADEFISLLPDGYASLLGPSFGGTDLSEGQWQRLALGRAFFRDAPLVILDEPTASLDARAEAELFRRMRELLAGRSVVLISHRLASVTIADRIYVLRDGRLVEAGPHRDLMRIDGHYAELFRLQSATYLAAVGER